MTTMTNATTKLTAQEERAFEAWAQRQGHNIRKERGLYCLGMLNTAHAAVIEFKRAQAQKGQ